ncbi:hypothetical protein JCM18507_33370 [Fusicatenibacter saccharivorans]
MTQIKHYELGELADVTKLAGFEFTKYIKYNNYGEIIALRALNLRHGELDLTDIKRIDRSISELLPRSKLYINDILLTYTGNGYGDCAIIEENDKYHLAPNICKIAPNVEKVVPYYLYSYIRTNEFYKIMSSHMTGSSQPTIPMKTIRMLPIPLPPIVVQEKIAEVAYCINEKIRKNNAINKNLEQQAKAVFKSWFEDFDPFDEPLIETPAGIYAPASLQMVQIANIPHVLETGKRPKGGAVASGVPSIGAENVKQLGVVNFSSAKFIPEEFAEKMKTGAINGYELLLYKDGGKPGTFIPHFSMFGEGFPYQKFFINEHVFKLDFGDKGFNEFAYFFMQTDYAYHWLASNGGKAAVPGINQQNVKDIWIFSPENSKVKEFGEWVQPLFTTILKNCAQNVKLAELRDTLLPKLMSGELDVSDIEL